MHRVYRQACMQVSLLKAPSQRATGSIYHTQSALCGLVIPGCLQLGHRQVRPRSTTVESETLGPGTARDPASCLMFDVFPAASDFGASIVSSKFEPVSV